MASITVSLEGLPEVKRLLEQFEGRELNNRARRAARAGIAIFRAAIRSEARTRQDVPDRFAKTKTRAHRNPIGVSVGPSSPLWVIFERGADSHPISPGPSGVLTNVGDEGRGSEALFFARGTVQHPGMRARPFIGPVFDENEDRAAEAFGDVLFEGID